MARRKKSVKRKKFKDKIRRKENRIRFNENVVMYSEEEIHSIMKRHKVADYRIEAWGDIRVTSTYDNWIITNDGEVITLLHETMGVARLGNHRSSFHIQNVFSDLDYCLRSIVEHDGFVRGRTRHGDG